MVVSIGMTNEYCLTAVGRKMVILTQVLATKYVFKVEQNIRINIFWNPNGYNKKDP